MTHKQHKSTEKYNDICDLKHRLLHYVNGEISGGFECSPHEGANPRRVR